MARLSKDDLLGKVLRGMQAGGRLPIVIEHAHPFLIRATHDDGAWVDLRIYVWNCTHGGGGRAASEFRVQFTTRPQRDGPRPTLLLGWHDDAAVFAAWDIDKHDGQDGSSPSAQIREDTLNAARDSAFSVQAKENEVVVAFRPAFLIDYALASESLHQGGRAHRDMALLNDLETLTNEQIEGVANADRKAIIRTITTKYRNRRFRAAVLDAYAHRCAFCRVQLSLLDAAHILPVSAPGSTDDVVNGIALCKLHHFAYDQNLVSFDPSYRIAVSQARVSHLRSMGRHGGLVRFEAGLRAELSLPADHRLRPSAANIRASRRVRGWRP
jgi:putative restriction endonuclease